MLSTGLVWKNVEAVRERAPIVHSITNFVVMNTTANALLATGASPIMAHAPEEMAELMGIASALVLNIGTLTKPWVESMLLAGMAARARRIPVVLDPVGAGATTLRTSTALEILDRVRPAVVRGNASEILALSGMADATRGVDSSHATHEAAQAARGLAHRYGCTVVVSGAEDIITDGDALWAVKGGSPIMPRVTGMGCTATVVVAAHAAVAASTLEAAVTGMAVMSAAGAVAAGASQGPGSFQVAFLDALYGMDLATVRDNVEVVRG